MEMAAFRPRWDSSQQTRILFTEHSGVPGKAFGFVDPAHSLRVPPHPVFHYNRSNSSKQIRIHSLAGANSAPLPAARDTFIEYEPIRPIKLIVASCTFSCRFLRIRVIRVTGIK